MPKRRSVSDPSLSETATVFLGTDECPHELPEACIPLGLLQGAEQLVPSLSEAGIFLSTLDKYDIVEQAEVLAIQCEPENAAGNLRIVSIKAYIEELARARDDSPSVDWRVQSYVSDIAQAAYAIGLAMGYYAARRLAGGAR